MDEQQARQDEGKERRKVKPMKFTCELIMMLNDKLMAQTGLASGMLKGRK